MVLNIALALAIPFRVPIFGLISSSSIADNGLIAIDTPVVNKPHDWKVSLLSNASTLFNAVLCLTILNLEKSIFFLGLISLPPNSFLNSARIFSSSSWRFFLSASSLSSSKSRSDSNSVISSFSSSSNSSASASISVAGSVTLGSSLTFSSFASADLAKSSRLISTLWGAGVGSSIISESIAFSILPFVFSKELGFASANSSSSLIVSTSASV